MKLSTPIRYFILAAFLLTAGFPAYCFAGNAPTEDGSEKKLKVLFLCTGNSCRSQMAEGWAHFLQSDRIEAYSAGVEPHGMNPTAVRVMKEAGVDISNQKSEHIDDYLDIPLDYVIAVCGNANDKRPVFKPSVKVIYHPFDDPPKLAKELENEEDQLNCYRRVRDEIKAYVETLPVSLAKEARVAQTKESSRRVDKTNRRPILQRIRLFR